MTASIGGLGQAIEAVIAVWVYRTLITFLGLILEPQNIRAKLSHPKIKHGNGNIISHLYQETAIIVTDSPVGDVLTTDGNKYGIVM